MEDKEYGCMILSTDLGGNMIPLRRGICLKCGKEWQERTKEYPEWFNDWHDCDEDNSNNE